MKEKLIEFNAEDARNFKYDIILSENEISEYNHIIEQIKKNLACGEIKSIWMINKNEYQYNNDIMSERNLNNKIKDKLLLNGFKIELVQGNYKIFWR